MPKPHAERKWEPPETLQSQLSRIPEHALIVRPALLLFILIEWAADRAYLAFDRIALVRLAVQAGVGLSVIAGLAAFALDLQDREQDRVLRAWKVMIDTREGGNFGQKDAVEFLHSKGRSLTNTNLQDTYLVRANLSGANLVGANLSGANLSGANLNRAFLLFANLNSADLSRAKLNGADLSRAELNRANLFEANLSEAILSEADLRGAILNGADLSGADLSKADLSGAILSGANLRMAILSGAELNGACGDGRTTMPKGFAIRYCELSR